MPTECCVRRVIAAVLIELLPLCPSISGINHHGRVRLASWSRPPQLSRPRCMRLRIKVTDGRKCEIALEDGATWGDLLTELLVKLDEPPQEVSAGFPPKRMVPQTHEQPLRELGIQSGDTLTVTVELPVGVLAETQDTAEPAMVVREMPDDNSCLFSAVSYVLHGTRERAGELRELVANLIASDPEYNEALLGMPVERYCQWILHRDRWGGGIELSAFAKHYEAEVASIDVASGRVDVFGESRGYTRRVYLLYSGIHYDALAMAQCAGAREDEDTTIFDPTDDSALIRAVEVAELARLEHRYTDLARFTLRCEQCGEALTGETEAQRHAVATGHVGFVEYN